MKKVLLIAVALLAVAASTDKSLPTLGTRFASLPEGKGKEEVEVACYRCHSADILVQQRLTAKQWTATVEKMARWGAAGDEKEKQVMIDYLAKHFGPTNRWTPLRTRAVGE